MTGSTSMSGGDAATPRRSMETSEVTGWVGWIVFAGTMMLLIGTFHVVQGLVALFDETYYVVTSANLVVSVDYNAWGWVHIIGGVIIFAAGLGLFTGRTWARALAVVLVAISAIINFAFIAAYPVWSLTLIALNILVIYALTAHGAEMKEVSREY